MAFGRKKDTEVPRDGLIDSYTVTYKGGLRELPKAKIGKITLGILEDRFSLTAGNDVARKFWTDLEIPYSGISAVEITDRTVSTFESFAGGLNSRQLNQKNNIHFAWLGADGPASLRVEMLTGVTVMGQAKKCQEFEDRLRSHHIRERFAGPAAHLAQDVGGSVADELTKFAAMRDQGILSEDEFAAQKRRLLG